MPEPSSVTGLHGLAFQMTLPQTVDRSSPLIFGLLSTSCWATLHPPPQLITPKQMGWWSGFIRNSSIAEGPPLQSTLDGRTSYSSPRHPVCLTWVVLQLILSLARRYTSLESFSNLPCQYRVHRQIQSLQLSFCVIFRRPCILPYLHPQSFMDNTRHTHRLT